MTYSLIERLSQLSGLRVMSHAEVTQYKNRGIDPRTIGNELGVGAVLTGRLTKRNDLLTINIELVNAADNSHIWGEQYDRKVSELLSLQREIPLDVSEKLRLKLTAESKERLSQKSIWQSIQSRNRRSAIFVTSTYIPDATTMRSPSAGRPSSILIAHRAIHSRMPTTKKGCFAKLMKST